MFLAVTITIRVRDDEFLTGFTRIAPSKLKNTKVLFHGECDRVIRSKGSRTRWPQHVPPILHCFAKERK